MKRSQFHAQILLQDLNLVAYGRMGEEQFIGGLPDTLSSRGRLEALEGVERRELPQIDLGGQCERARG